MDVGLHGRQSSLPATRVNPDLRIDVVVLPEVEKLAGACHL